MRIIMARLLALVAGWSGTATLAQVEIEISNPDRFFSEAGVRGSVTLYDPAVETWYHTDRNDADRPTLPASTFKIVNSLILLQEAVVRDPQERIPWDGVERTLGGEPYPAWNRDHTLASAFKNSALWVYQVLSQRVAQDTYRQWLSKISYGNGALDEAGTLFWLTGDFGVTPRQQINMLYSLYHDTLPFDVKHQQSVKKMMASTPPENIRSVAGKTGLVTQGGQDIGWWCGWLEVSDSVAPESPSRMLFFATRLTHDAGVFDPNFAALRQQITYRVAEAILSLETLKK